MADEPSLPRLPAISWNEHTQSFSNNPRKRGRARRSSNATPLFNNSSDPAVFSSDDDPALDNYVEGRRKKRGQPCLPPNVLPERRFRNVSTKEMRMWICL
ncbi:hypothetical protein HYQ45_004381 [Verticillium longisporum]|uniref:Uncharacterized protein n=1 Tax=Verticillium longisporum TaxID=100787 RepID=A0A8I3AT51_VERLO|nr:hypothetical protein HYQ45_004381 [Verticillium longisporum]